MTFNFVVQSWTSDRVETLKTLYAAGLSCSDIATDLGGVSRNAVISKIHRLKLTLRGNRPPSVDLIAKRAAKKPRVRLLTFTERKPPTLPSPPIAHIPTCEPVTFEQLNDTHCRYVTAGEGLSALFCGANKERGSYCGYHANLCHVGHVALGPAEAEIRRRLIMRGKRAPPPPPTDTWQKLGAVANQIVQKIGDTA